MPLKKLISFLSLLLAFTALPSVSHESPFVVNVSDTVQSEKRKRDTEKLFLAIYQDIGITPQFRYLPSLRGLALVNQGEYDAEAGRLEKLARNYGNLVQIPTPLTVLEFAMFCIDKRKCNTSSSVKVAVLKGFRQSAQLCKKMNITCTQVDSVVALAKLVKEGLADTALTATMIAPQFLCLLDSEAVFYSHNKEFDTHLFHYVHKKHTQLVDSLNQALKKIKRNGLIDKLMRSWKDDVKSCNKRLIEM